MVKSYHAAYFSVVVGRIQKEWKISIFAANPYLKNLMVSASPRFGDVPGSSQIAAWNDTSRVKIFLGFKSAAVVKLYLLMSHNFDSKFFFWLTCSITFCLYVSEFKKITYLIYDINTENY